MGKQQRFTKEFKSRWGARAAWLKIHVSLYRAC